MKAIMYHYVRPDRPELPFFNHLHIDDFRSQLDYFGREYGFVPRDAFLGSFKNGDIPSGVVLTFDDGLRDHYEFVLPELVARGLWGIFYVPGLPLVQERLLDVHRIHLLIGMFGGAHVLPELEKLVTDDLLVHAHREEFTSQTYATHDDKDATKMVKRILNYFIDVRFRDRIVDQLLEHFGVCEAEVRQGYYMSRTELRELHKAGMIIGAHSMTHPVMSTLAREAQEREIKESLDIIRDIVGESSVRTYCHPYGRFHSFNKDTEDILSEEQCLFSFNVEPRDISSADVRGRPQALPRYDCAQFPHGAVRRAQ